MHFAREKKTKYVYEVLEKLNQRLEKQKSHLKNKLQNKSKEEIIDDFIALNIDSLGLKKKIEYINNHRLDRLKG